MSALMPETNRKNCVDPTVSPMCRQNTSNQTPANASTSAAQLTASLGPYTACPGPLLVAHYASWRKKYKTSSTVDGLLYSLHKAQS